MSQDKDRKVAAITGAGTGIGYAIAEELLDAGFEIAICGRRKDVIADAQDRLRASSTRVVESASFDLATEDGPTNFIQFTLERLGSLDTLVNNACPFATTNFLELNAHSWDEILHPGLRGVALASAAAARHMRNHGGGRIVHISSIDAIVSEPNVAHYNAAKAGVASLARSMAYDLSRHNIIVNAVAPGWIKTPSADWALESAPPEAMERVNPLGRWGSSREVASLVRYLCTDAPAFLTGATIPIDGGQTAIAVMPE